MVFHSVVKIASWRQFIIIIKKGVLKTVRLSLWPWIIS